MSWLIASLRRLRHGRVALAGIGGLVLVTSFLAAAGPRLFDRVTRDSIQAALAEIPPADRVIQLSRLEGSAGQRTAAAVDLAALDRDGVELRKTLPPPFPELLGPTSLVVETPALRAVSGPSLAAELRLRIMPGAADHVRLMTGRAPGGALGEAPDPLHSGSQNGQDPSTATIELLEADISQVAADKIGVTVGSQIVMVPDVTLDARSSGSAIAVTIVGTYEPAARDDPFWIDDTRVLGYELHEYSSNLTFVQTTLLLAPEAFGSLVGFVPAGSNGFLSWGPPPRQVTWRFPADPARLAPETLPAAVAALRRLETVYRGGVSADAGAVTLDSRLLGRLVALGGPWAAAGSVLGVAAVGAGAVALAALALVLALTADERRRIVVLQRERGASGFQSIVGILVEGAIVTVPAASVGAGLAILLVPGREDGRAVAAAILVAGAAIALELALLIRSVVGPPREPGRRGAPVVRGVPPRRLVLEVLVVGLAVVGAKLLRDRGLGIGGAGTASVAAGVVEPTSIGGSSAPDPFLTAVPVLVGIAAGLVALRLAPAPIAAFARITAIRRDLGPVLAARRAARAPGASRVLLIVLAIATLGAFASATILHLTRTADLQAWQNVGAAFRVDAAGDQLGGTVFPDHFDVRSVPGVDAAARAHLANVQLSSGGQRELIAVDVPVLSQVLAGTPIAPALPDALSAPPDARAGTAAAPLPAVMSTRGAGPYRLAVGDTFRIALSSQAVSFRVVAAVDRFPGIAATTSFVVASWPQIDAVAPHRLQGTTTVYVRAGSGAATALADAAHAAAPTAVVSEQRAGAAHLAGQPVVGVVTRGVIALLAIALVYATLAVVASFVLAASSRALETAELATLGLGGTTAGSMLLVEYGPPVLLATIIGTALGLGLFAFLAPGLGFETIVGVLQTAPPGLDPVQIGLLALGVAAILAIGVALGAPAQRRAAWAAARRGLT